jgi:hypothetical protein
LGETYFKTKGEIMAICKSCLKNYSSEDIGTTCYACGGRGMIQPNDAPNIEKNNIQDFITDIKAKLAAEYETDEHGCDFWTNEGLCEILDEFQMFFNLPSQCADEQRFEIVFSEGEENDNFKHLENRELVCEWLRLYGEFWEMYCE